MLQCNIRRRHSLFRPSPAIRSKLFASLKGFPRLSGVLLNFVIGTSLFLLRNAYCVIRTALLKKTSKTVARRAFVENIRQRHQLLCNISASRFAQRLSTSIRGTFELRCWNCVVGTAFLKIN